MSELIFYGSPRKRKGMRIGKKLVAGWGEGKVIKDRMDRIIPGHPSAFYGASDFTIHLIRECQKKDLEWYYVDNAYFGRDEYYRITLQNLYLTEQNTAPNFERFEKLGIHPNLWHNDPDGFIMICPQSSQYTEIFDLPDMRNWTENIHNFLRRFTKRKIRIRKKPTPRELRHRTNPIEEEFKGCYAVVVRNSNAALDAIYNGIPAFCTVRCHLSQLCSEDLIKIEDPYYPSLDHILNWSATLAANQWTLDEIQEGTAWEMLRGYR